MAEPKLRRYQSKAVAKAIQLLRKKKRVLMVSPTGSGKTTAAVGLILKIKPKRVLWLAHRIELIRQAQRELVAAGVPSDSIGILSGAERVNESAQFLIASVDMFRARRVEPLNPDLLVVDEAHRVASESYQNIIWALPKAKIIGLTATPRRLDGKPLGDTFNEMVVMAGQAELIHDGFIANPITYGIPLEKARQLVKGLSKGGRDYSGSASGKRMMQGRLMGDLVKEWVRLAEGRPTIVFAASREYGKKITARLAKVATTMYLDGESTGDHRRAATEGLTSGTVQIVVNVDVLTEGFDCPPVSCIVLARPTKSLVRFLQQVGRGNRPYRNARTLVLDHAGNCWRFGLPQAEREWSLSDEAKLHGKGDAPVKTCLGCEAVIPAGCHECPECGAEQPLPKHDQEEADAELERIRISEIEQRRLRAQLVKLASHKGLDSDWVESVMRRSS